MIGLLGQDLPIESEMKLYVNNATILVHVTLINHK